MLGDADVPKGLRILPGGYELEAVEVTGITHRSDAVVAGSAYCCLRGERSDGHDFAPAAVAAGAAVLVCERPLDLGVVELVVPEARAAMAALAASFHGHPSKTLRVVGITGTNGKTTTAALLAAVLEAAGMPTEVVGTLGRPPLSTPGAAGVGGASAPGTTPDAVDLQAELAAMRDRGTTAVALEVSSHALTQHRVDALSFAVGVFTNLSPDHLDYHGTMDAYFEAKARMFAPGRAQVGVVNEDDEWGRRLLAAASIPTRPFGLVDAADLRFDSAATTFRWEGADVRLQLRGAGNVANALAAATAARELGAAPDAVAEGLSGVATVPGRLEPIASAAPFPVLVDYAHTPAALEVSLAAARQIAGQGRLVVVFGCGGGRDRSKRPLMGEIAARLADVAVLTTDNPRDEEPGAILDEVRAGVTRLDRLVVEPDRRAAIALALGRAGTGDVVVVAGKGHETTQILGAATVPFDDRVVVAEELGRLGW